MKKILFLSLLIPITGLAQSPDQPFTIKGKFNNLAHKPEWVHLMYRVGDVWKADSVKPTGNSYRFKGSLPEPGMARIRVVYAPDEKGGAVASRPSRDVAVVFLEKGTIRVSSTDSFSHVKVKGSAADAAYRKFQAAEKPFNDRMEPLVNKYSEYAKAKDKVNQQKVEDELDAITAEKNEKVYGAFVRNNPASPLALYALKQYAGWDIDADKVEPLFNTLSATNKNYPSAEAFREQIETAKKTGIGRIAMDFTQNDTLDRPVSLSAFRGKYLLVDFWASWCGPCRAENPNVVKVFNQYKDRNFHILGVSLDRPGQKERWMKAIHEDQLTWSHVSDLQFWNNEVAKQYGIRAIPQNLLLDPEGKIIAKNLRGEELEKKLGELIK